MILRFSESVSYSVSFDFFFSSGMKDKKDRKRGLVLKMSMQVFRFLYVPGSFRPVQSSENEFFRYFKIGLNSFL
jgi:hypothetical protein